MKLLTSILKLLYPPKCIACKKLLPDDEADLCASCRKSLPIYEGEGVSGDFFTNCIAPFHYEGELRESLLRYKFNGCSHYAPAYGRLLAEYLRGKGRMGFDVISWVPVSAKRKRKRGYDQTKLLAQAVAKELKVALMPTLQKVKDNPAQSAQKDYAIRRANVQGVYRPVKPERFQGKTVLLIDDICTSGATLSESSRVLLTAGAGRVMCAALAIAD